MYSAESARPERLVIIDTAVPGKLSSSIVVTMALHLFRSSSTSETASALQRSNSAKSTPRSIE